MRINSVVVMGFIGVGGRLASKVQLHGDAKPSLPGIGTSVAGNAFRGYPSLCLLQYYCTLFNVQW